MQIANANSAERTFSPAVDQDCRVKTLKAKIADWANCPTTDPQTKASIVGRLQAQLDSVESSLKAQDAQVSGLGNTLDLYA